MSEYSQSLKKVLAEAIRDFTEHGFDRPQRLDEWIRRLNAAARQGKPNSAEIDKRIAIALEQIFKRVTSHAAIAKHHPGVMYLMPRPMTIVSGQQVAESPSSLFALRKLPW